MKEVVYICTAGCGDSATEEEYRGGKAVCAVSGCEKFGQPLDRKIWCSECGGYVNDAHEHTEKSAPLLSRPMLYAGVGVGFVLIVLYLLLNGVQSYFRPRSKGNDLAAALQVFEKTKTIEVTDYDFMPKTGAVKFGDKVTWKNLGTQAHTVTFRFLSKNLYPGEEWSWTIGRDIFTQGENIYWCDIHRGKGMDGASLVVAE
ncbi:MAG TPA: hypothetical protein VGL70_19345 [Candidatus Binatia bacterium]|jgi:plastocyanin